MTVKSIRLRQHPVTHRSSLLFSWDYRDGFDVNGQPVTVNGVSGTFTRAGTKTCVDANGRVYTVPYGMPAFHHSTAGVALGVLLEGARTNLCLQSQTFGTTWVASNITVAANSTTAPDGTTTADTLTASAGNGTLIQDLGVLANVAYAGGLWIKRKTGTGNIQLTMDNGATWTTVTVTASWTRVQVTQTLANPDFGVRIVTNADAVYVWQGQVETGSFLTSDIPTVAATVARVADAFSFPFLKLPTALTLYTKFTEAGTIHVDATGVCAIGYSTNAAFIVFNDGGAYETRHRVASDVFKTAVAVPVLGDTVELRSVLASDGSVLTGQAINAAAEVVTAASSALALASAWSTATLILNDRTTGSNTGLIALQQVKIVVGVQTLAYMRTAR